MQIYLIEFQFVDRRQVDRVVALSRAEGQRRAHRVVDEGIALSARLIPLKSGRATVVRPPVRIWKSDGKGGAA
jgi:hypothetical protein